MSRDQQSTLRLFGEYMPRLVAEIEQLYKHGKFTEMPLGPIGAFVEVNNAKYLGVVEDALKSVLHAFYVNDAKDRVVLNELFRKYPGARATVITSRFMKRVRIPHSFCSVFGVSNIIHKYFRLLVATDI